MALWQDVAELIIKLKLDPVDYRKAMQGIVGLTTGTAGKELPGFGDISYRSIAKVNTELSRTSKLIQSLSQGTQKAFMPELWRQQIYQTKQYGDQLVMLEQESSKVSGRIRSMVQTYLDVGKSVGQGIDPAKQKINELMQAFGATRYAIARGIGLKEAYAPEVQAIDKLISKFKTLQNYSQTGAEFRKTSRTSAGMVGGLLEKVQTGRGNLTEQEISLLRSQGARNLNEFSPAEFKDLKKFGAYQTIGNMVIPDSAISSLQKYKTELSSLGKVGFFPAGANEQIKIAFSQMGIGLTKAQKDYITLNTLTREQLQMIEQLGYQYNAKLGQFTKGGSVVSNQIVAQDLTKIQRNIPGQQQLLTSAAVMQSRQAFLGSMLQYYNEFRKEAAGGQAPQRYGEHDVKARERLNQLMTDSEKNLQGQIDKQQTIVNTTQKGTAEYEKQNGKLTQMQRSLHFMKQGHQEVNDIINKTTQGAVGMSGAFDMALRRVVLWGSASMAIYGSFRFIKSLITDIRDLDAEFQQLRGILSGTDADMRDLTNAAFSFAEQFGRTPKEVVSTMTEIAKTGKNTADVLTLTEVALIGANAAGLDLADSGKTLTSVMDQFNMSTNEAMHIMDSWTALSRQMRVNTKDLETAMQATGEGAEEVGMSFDKYSAMVATISKVTGQSGTAIAATFKSIFGRLEQPKTIEQLGKIGITPYLPSGELKNFGDLLDEIASKWDTLSNTEQMNLSIAMAEKRRYTSLLALLNNYSTYQNAVNISVNSAGEAANKNAIIMDSISKRWASFTAVFTDFKNVIGGAIKPLSSVVLPALQALLGIVTTISRILPGGLGKVAIGFLAVAAAGKLMLRGLGMAGATMGGEPGEKLGFGHLFNWAMYKPQKEGAGAIGGQKLVFDETRGWIAASGGTTSSYRVSPIEKYLRPTATSQEISKYQSNLLLGGVNPEDTMVSPLKKGIASTAAALEGAKKTLSHPFSSLKTYFKNNFSGLGESIAGSFKSIGGFIKANIGTIVMVGAMLLIGKITSAIAEQKKIQEENIQGVKDFFKSYQEDLQKVMPTYEPLKDTLDFMHEREDKINSLLNDQTISMEKKIELQKQLGALQLNEVATQKQISDALKDFLQAHPMAGVYGATGEIQGLQPWAENMYQKPSEQLAQTADTMLMKWDLFLKSFEQGMINGLNWDKLQVSYGKAPEPGIGLETLTGESAKGLTGYMLGGDLGARMFSAPEEIAAVREILTAVGMTEDELSKIGKGPVDITKYVPDIKRLLGNITSGTQSLTDLQNQFGGFVKVAKGTKFEKQIGATAQEAEKNFLKSGKASPMEWLQSIDESLVRAYQKADFPNQLISFLHRMQTTTYKSLSGEWNDAINKAMTSETFKDTYSNLPSIMGQIPEAVKTMLSGPSMIGPTGKPLQGGNLSILSSEFKNMTDTYKVAQDSISGIGDISAKISDSLQQYNEAKDNVANLYQQGTASQDEMQQALNRETLFREQVNNQYGELATIQMTAVQNLQAAQVSWERVRQELLALVQTFGYLNMGQIEQVINLPDVFGGDIVGQFTGMRNKIMQQQMGATDLLVGKALNNEISPTWAYGSIIDMATGVQQQAQMEADQVNKANQAAAQAEQKAKQAEQARIQNMEKMLDHLKTMDEITLVQYKSVLEYLLSAASTEEERMGIEEKIKSTEKEIAQQKLSYADEWISHEDAMGKMNTTQKLEYLKQKLAMASSRSDRWKIEEDIYKTEKETVDNRLDAAQKWLDHQTTMDSVTKESQIKILKRILEWTKTKGDQYAIWDVEEKIHSLEKDLSGAAEELPQEIVKRAAGLSGPMRISLEEYKRFLGESSPISETKDMFQEFQKYMEDFNNTGQGSIGTIQNLQLAIDNMIASDQTAIFTTGQIISMMNNFAVSQAALTDITYETVTAEDILISRHGDVITQLQTWIAQLDPLNKTMQGSVDILKSVGDIINGITDNEATTSFWDSMKQAFITIGDYIKQWRESGQTGVPGINVSVGHGIGGFGMAPGFGMMPSLINGGPGDIAAAAGAYAADVQAPYHYGSHGPGSCSHNTSHGVPFGGEYSHEDRSRYPVGCFDCSGLVQWAWEQAGVGLSAPSGNQFEASIIAPVGSFLADALLRPGALLFKGDPYSHVGMYYGNNRVVEASSTGNPVELRDYFDYNKWKWVGWPRLHEGGYSPDKEGWAILKKEELVLAPPETKAFREMVDNGGTGFTYVDKSETNINGAGLSEEQILNLIRKANNEKIANIERSFKARLR
ncbi:MAG: phage tail tape measure protein [Phycisphaerae bacterium]|jgi:TP901 family phage tail tape measure protein